jgi:hypothetical protein
MLRLGRKPPENKPALRLTNYLTGIVPEHPVAADYLANLKNWQMLGNDQYGDCVAVTWANVRRLLTAALTGKEAYPTLDQVLTLYKTQNPNFPTDDEGMVIQTCLEYLVKNGGPDGVKALGFARVDMTNQAEIDAAIGIFGFIWAGVYVQQVNMTQFDMGKPWDYSPLSKTIGGHSIITGGYNKIGQGALAGYYDFITYGLETSYTKNFSQHLGEEGWVVIWPEHLGVKAFMEGIDLVKFADAYKALTGKEFPVDVTPTPVPDPEPEPATGTTFPVYTTASGQLKLKNKTEVSTFNKGEFKITVTK